MTDAEIEALIMNWSLALGEFHPSWEDFRRHVRLHGDDLAAALRQLRAERDAARSAQDESRAFGFRQGVALALDALVCGAARDGECSMHDCPQLRPGAPLQCIRDIACGDPECDAPKSARAAIMEACAEWIK